MIEDLHQTIIEAMETDDSSSPAKISHELVDQYENSNQNEQTTMNELFITLTGWSFETLLERVTK